MPRWDRDGEQRLRTAAVELFIERGYDDVTVAEIAERAGLTRRTFSRYFADKRDVLFAGADQLPQIMAEALRRVDAQLPPFPAVLQALDDVAHNLGDEVAEYAQQRRDIVAGSPELKERGRSKFAAVAQALADALRDRGAEKLTATLFADIAVALFRTGFDSWADAPQGSNLTTHIRRAGAELCAAVEPPFDGGGSALLTNRSSSSPAVDAKR